MASCRMLEASIYFSIIYASVAEGERTAFLVGALETESAMSHGDLHCRHTDSFTEGTET